MTLYPLPGLDAAWEHLEWLELLLRTVDSQLAQAFTPALEARRVELGHEFDMVHEAIAYRWSDVRNLPRCACGHRSHWTIGSAERHAQSMRVIDEDAHRGAIDTYRCRLSGAWHVGHFGKRWRPR